MDRKGAPGRAEVMKRFANVPVQVKAGTYDVAVTFIERARVESDEFVGFLPGDEFSRGDREPRLVGGVTGGRPVQLAGRVGHAEPPQDLRLPARTPGRTERACARRIAATLARARVPPSGHRSRTWTSLMPFFDEGRTRQSGFDAGIEQLMAAVLVSPDFLYRTMHTPAGGSKDPQPADGTV